MVFIFINLHSLGVPKYDTSKCYNILDGYILRIFKTDTGEIMSKGDFFFVDSELSFHDTVNFEYLVTTFILNEQYYEDINVAKTFESKVFKYYYISDHYKVLNFNKYTIYMYRAYVCGYIKKEPVYNYVVMNRTSHRSSFLNQLYDIKSKKANILYPVMITVY